MKVRVLLNLGTRDFDKDHLFKEGQVVDTDDEFAQDLIKRGFAEAVDANVMEGIPHPAEVTGVGPADVPRPARVPK